jgi:hypothetical protein
MAVVIGYRAFALSVAVVTAQFTVKFSYLMARSGAARFLAGIPVATHDKHSYLPALTCLYLLACSHLPALAYLCPALRTLCLLSLTNYVIYLLLILSYALLPLRRLLTYTLLILWQIGTLSLTPNSSSSTLILGSSSSPFAEYYGYPQR